MPCLNQHVTCAAVLRSKRDTSKSLHITDVDIWKAQQEDSSIQDLYNKIMKTGEITENSTTKLTVLEDKVYRVVHLLHKSLYQMYIPTSLRQQLLHHYHDEPLSGHLAVAGPGILAHDQFGCVIMCNVARFASSTNPSPENLQANSNIQR